ncbi:SMI1/KNR4 family protein [Lentzea sp. NPDC051213]|uniref:SMI1/KNR4 family protein n=1 Tax=Lentzea sp. NPDC051213 TaxID=3364126 RepID=UPI0037B6C60D
MTEPVEVSWERISTWLRMNAPRTRASVAAPSSEVDDQLTRFPLPLPHSLAIWWRLTGGAGHSDLLPPFYAPLSAEEALAAYEGLRTDPVLDEEEEAGSRSGVFLPEFLPIAAAGTGDFLFVDLRTGDARGCVRDWARDDGSLGVTRWQGVAEMLADVADALVHDRPALRWHAEQAAARFFTAATYEPAVEDGTLRWVASETFRYGS